MTGVGKKMAKGVRWSLVDKGGQQGITFLVFAVLARFVAPEDFGLVAMALLIIGFVQLFIDQGFSTAIIQRETLSDEMLSTAFWTNIAIGMLLGAVLIALRGYAAWFFSEPRVAELIPWMAVALILEALMSVPQALLKRNFDFKGLALRTLYARLIAGVVAIGGAASGWGVWSLVAFTVLSGALSTAILWWISDWRPGFRFSIAHFRGLFRFGGHVTGVRIMSYINSKALDVFIGYFFGATALGYYTLAMQLVGRIGSVMVQVLSQVTMSGFSRLQADAELLLKQLLAVTRLTSAVAFPVFALLGAMAPDIVLLLYGSGWERSAVLIGMLAPIGPAMVMSSVIGDAIMGAGKPHLIFRARILATALLVISLLAVRSFGADIMVLVFAISYFVFGLPLYLIASKRVLPLSVRSYSLQYSPAVLATAALLLTVFFVRSWVANVGAPLLEMAVTGCSAVTMYVLVLMGLDRRIMVDLRRVLLSGAA